MCCCWPTGWCTCSTWPLTWTPSRSSQAGFPSKWRHPVALVLLTATILGFSLVALSTWGVPGLASSWPALTLVAAALSALMLVVFWDRQLIFGLAIDAALIAVALWQPAWQQQILPITP